MNPVILGALVVQRLISSQSRVVGAVAGYVITTGILLWGLDVYSSGGGVAFLGIPLPRSAFFVSCLIWYGFDTLEFRKAAGDGHAGAVAWPINREGSDHESNRSM